MLFEGRCSRIRALLSLQEHTLNDQQVRAVAPVVHVIDQMWATRSNCLWLGAGGSKTWAYTQVLRPLFCHVCGKEGFVAGAPTHAAVRLLGPEARTLHKLANVNPNAGLDRRSLRAQKGKNDALEKRIVRASACVLDELSMTPPDVYHATGYRFALQRGDALVLDNWATSFRPAAQKSLCEWQEAVSAVETALPDDAEDAPGAEVSNASQLGRLLFKNSARTVVHFTGTGRFSSCESGQALVRILTMPDDLWALLRALQSESLSSDIAKEQFLTAYWGGFSWEQVARLQHVRAAMEARAAGQQLYIAQAIDKPTGGRSLSAEQASAALKVVNMTKTGYLIGMCPLFVGMKARVLCILPEPMLTRELPCVLRRIELHPKEPPVDSRSACVAALPAARPRVLAAAAARGGRDSQRSFLCGACERQQCLCCSGRQAAEVQRCAQAG